MQVHDVAFDGTLTPPEWMGTSVADIRWYIENGRFLQHWYVFDVIAEQAAIFGGTPPDAYDVEPDVLDERSVECELCGEYFDVGSIYGTRDWRGHGMDCCGCGNECGVDSRAPVDRRAPGVRRWKRRRAYTRRLAWRSRPRRKCTPAAV